MTPTAAIHRLLGALSLVALLGETSGAQSTSVTARGADGLIGRGLTGGSSVVLDSTIIRSSVARTLADLLSARVPGLNVTYATGAPGYAPEITARGAAGIFGPGRPLLYVDGALQREDRHLIGQIVDRQRPSHIWSLPTDEIESVEVVLGPSGGTLLAFGSSRGAVIVRTRRATSKAWRLTQYSEVSASAAPSAPAARVTTTGLTATGSTDFCPLSDQATGYCAPNGTKVHRAYGGDSPFQTSMGLRAGVGAEGGLGLATVRLAANVDKSAGPVTNNGFERYDFSATANTARWRALTGTLAARYARTNGAYARMGTDGILQLGGTAVQPTDTAFALSTRIADSILARSLPYHTDRLSLAVGTEWAPRPWLTAFAHVDAERATRGSDLTVAQYTVFPADQLSGRERDLSTFRQGTTAASLGVRATRALPLGLRVTGEVGGHLANADIDERRVQRQDALNGTWSLDETTITPDLRSTSVYSAVRLSAGPDRSVGGGFRKEATRLFGQIYGDDAFNTLDAQWTISNERFFPRLPGIDRLSVHGAYGESGDHESPLSLFDFTALFGNTTGRVPPRLPRTLEREAGIDLTLLGGAATLGLTTFTRSLRDGYFNFQAGGIGPPLSFASWGTHGAEWSLHLPTRGRGLFRWNARVSWSSARTSISQAQFPDSRISLAFGLRTYYGTDIPFGAIHTTGYTFADANGDGIIDATEITLDGAITGRGVTQPTDVLGFTGEVRWSGWLRAGLSLDGKTGHLKYDGTSAFGCQILVCRDLYDENASLARQARAVASGYTSAFTGPVHKAAFVRARDLWVRIVLPARLGPLAMQGASLTFAARNVGLWSLYPSGDPETGSFAFATVQRGDFYTPALQPTYSLRIDLAR